MVSARNRSRVQIPMPIPIPWYRHRFRNRYITSFKISLKCAMKKFVVEFLSQFKASSAGDKGVKVHFTFFVVDSLNEAVVMYRYLFSDADSTDTDSILTLRFHRFCRCRYHISDFPFLRIFSSVIFF